MRFVTILKGEDFHDQQEENIYLNNNCRDSRDYATVPRNGRHSNNKSDPV